MLLDDLFAAEGMLRQMEIGERARVSVNRVPKTKPRPKPAQRGANYRENGKPVDFWSDADQPDRPDRSEAARQVRAENSRRMQASLIRCPRASRVS